MHGDPTDQYSPLKDESREHQMPRRIDHQRLNAQKRQAQVPKSFKAEWQARCTQCTLTINVGETIQYSGAGVMHVECPLTTADYSVNDRLRARRERLAAERAALAEAQNTNAKLREIFTECDIPLPEGVSR